MQIVPRYIFWKCLKCKWFTTRLWSGQILILTCIKWSNRKLTNIWLMLKFHIPWKLQKTFMVFSGGYNVGILARNELTHFHRSLSIPPKNIRNIILCFSDVFMGYRKRPVTSNVLPWITKIALRLCLKINKNDSRNSWKSDSHFTHY